MAHVGGSLQAQFMARVRGQDLSRCLVVPVDVGKSSAMALVADHYGELVVAPFEFALNEPGFTQLVSAIARADGARFSGRPLGDNDFVVSADEKTPIQARCRCHPSLNPHKLRAIGLWAGLCT